MHKLMSFVLSPLCFHGLTNCFSRKPFVFIMICVAPPCRLHDRLSVRTLLHSSRSFCTRVPLLSASYRLFCKSTGGGVGQRGRGRNGGRAVSGRGRMRNRGPSGGGTLRSELPQQGQRPSSQKARVASARSQWPLASHCGLMHWTVKPGRNCISFSPQRPACFCAAGRVARDPNSL